MVVTLVAFFSLNTYSDILALCITRSDCTLVIILSDLGKRSLLSGPHYSSINILIGGMLMACVRYDY